MQEMQKKAPLFNGICLNRLERFVIKMQFIPYGRQYIDEDDISAVINVLKSDWLTQGATVNEFEQHVAEYHNCKYAVAFCNGTAALHGAYYVSTKLPYGSSRKEATKVEDWEFISTPLTFAATINAGLYCGGKVCFADIDPNTYCLDIKEIEDKITEKTRVISPISYAGYPIDVKAIKELKSVKDNNLCIIHDACHALGARRNGHGVAEFADMTILSFHPVKHITTGEGGMVLTNNEEIYKKLLLFRNHGITKHTEEFINQSEGPWYYEMHELGYNYRITDIQCALGISQMHKVDDFLYKRNCIAKLYESKLRRLDWLSLPPRFDNDISRPVKDMQDLHSYHLFPILINNHKDRREFFEYMRDSGIGVQVHYRPVSQLEYYKSLGYTNGESFSESKDYYERTVTLPMYFSLSEDEIAYIVEKIENWGKLNF